MLVNARCLDIKFDAHKNVCIPKFRKKIIDTFLKIENESLSSKLFIRILMKYDGFKNDEKTM